MVVYSSLDRWDMPQGATVPFSRLDFQDKVRLATLGSNTLPRTAPLGTVRYPCHSSDISQLSINPDKNTMAQSSGTLQEDKVNNSSSEGAGKGQNITDFGKNSAFMWELHLSTTTPSHPQGNSGGLMLRFTLCAPFLPEFRGVFHKKHLGCVFMY